MDNTLKNWGWLILFVKYFTLGPFSPGRVSFDLHSIFVTSLPKLAQSTQYFCVLLTLTILDHKQESFIDDFKIHNSTMACTHPGSKLTRVVLTRVKIITFAKLRLGHT